MEPGRATVADVLRRHHHCFPTCLAAIIVTAAVANGEPQKSAPAPPAANGIDALGDIAEAWARENIDDSVLAMFGQLDRDRIRGLFTELEKRLHADSVYDLGALRDNARSLLPLLQQFEDTAPYAVWLQNRLEYLDAADQLRRDLTPKPPVPPKPGQPPAVPKPPTVKQQRIVWEKRVSIVRESAESHPIADKLKPVFASEGVPDALVWIAEVESGFDARATSPAGAAGLFQLMPPTAKSLGLSTWFPDERRNPEKSARAAAHYLKQLYQRFGDWRLVLAAYNAGEGRVAGLLKNSKAKTFDAIAAKLPAETQMYVPRCEAVIRKREGVWLADLKAPRG